MFLKQFFLIITFLITNLIAFEILTTSAMIAGLGFAGYHLRDKFSKIGESLCLKECCHDKSSKNWINHEPDLTDLNDYIFGQHIAIQLVPKMVKNHLQNDNPRKPLVMSFHGYTGIGKNYLSEFLAKNIYRQYNQTGSSKFVTKIIATHFKPENTSAIQIAQLVDHVLRKCDRSMFIFDEIDKFPEQFLDVLLPFLVESSPRKGAIFIFLGNSGGNNINAEVNRLLMEGRPREEIQYKDLEKIVTNGAIKKGGLKNSELITRGVIDLFVPFLPLERKHVEQCIVDYLKRHQNFPDPDHIPGSEFIQKVLNEVEFFDDRYSLFGCRRISSIVDMML